MPWKNVIPMEERVRFVMAIKEKSQSFSRICEQFGVSRRVGYKWWHRYEEGGFDGLKELSRRPKKSPGQVTEVWKQRVVELRLKHRWGPKKLHTRLKVLHPKEAIPSASTMERMVKKEGLVFTRKRQKKWPRIGSSFKLVDVPNAVWAVDFKGWFITGDGKRCEALTISDLYSRYVLYCQSVESTRHEIVEKVFRNVFRRYGLPQRIRSDNGVPFGSRGVAGLSKLSLWWLTIGIEPELIEPGHPEQNGIHERMHRNLKADTAMPPAPTLKAQNQRFEEWRRCYNEERPHEALGQKTPLSCFQLSPRVYQDLRVPFAYPSDYKLRTVHTRGDIKLNARTHFIGMAFYKYTLGLKEIQKGLYEVNFHHKLLGTLNNDASGGLVPLKRTTSTTTKVLPML
jgi:putative transposase